MKTPILIVLNGGLFVLFIYLLRRELLSYHHKGRWWLTWLAIAVITLMDEFTSIFYAPAEAYRFIGPSAIVFIAVTSLLIRFMSTRFTEIAEILEHHGLIGGGVYSFSYLVLGPMVSFVAVASIMVDYILTACISAVSAVANAASFFAFSDPLKIVLVLAIIWGVAGLNILGIRENARFTFMIFIGRGLRHAQPHRLRDPGPGRQAMGQIHLAANAGNQTVHNRLLDETTAISSPASPSASWPTPGWNRSSRPRDLCAVGRRSARPTRFWALTVGVVTPVVAALALSANIDFKAHEGDLITYYATMLNGVPFGLAVAALASFTLTMAVNTAFVASSELMERVAHRYGFHWFIATNRVNPCTAFIS